MGPYLSIRKNFFHCSIFSAFLAILWLKNGTLLSPSADVQWKLLSQGAVVQWPLLSEPVWITMAIERRHLVVKKLLYSIDNKGASHQRRARRDLDLPLFLTKNHHFLGLGITWVHTEVLGRIFSLLHFSAFFGHFVAKKCNFSTKMQIFHKRGMLCQMIRCYKFNVSLPLNFGNKWCSIFINRK